LLRKYEDTREVDENSGSWNQGDKEEDEDTIK
jgi:hypothetical protein